jgi:hypothetical protein
MFDPREILEEFEEAAGRGREWFAADSFRVCRTSLRPRGLGRKGYAPTLRDDPDVFRAYKARWMREWRQRHPDEARTKDRTRYARQMADPTQCQQRRQRDAEAQRRRRNTPEGRARSAAHSLRYYHQRVADPAKREALRRYQRERYRARKEAASV